MLKHVEILRATFNKLRVGTFIISSYQGRIIDYRLMASRQNETRKHNYPRQLSLHHFDKCDHKNTNFNL